ncbi:hypothetical protein F5I97DRAFT_1844580 [Phlebopus sp. FC_14]|nr:hypothetical protein F5I97DRAFT_1844580 [Phlebopus sp. FC_14]
MCWWLAVDRILDVFAWLLAFYVMRLVAFTLPAVVAPWTLTGLLSLISSPVCLLSSGGFQHSPSGRQFHWRCPPSDSQLVFAMPIHARSYATSSCSPMLNVDSCNNDL